jgi:hypothetical protein
MVAEPSRNPGLYATPAPVLGIDRFLDTAAAPPI